MKKITIFIVLMFLHSSVYAYTLDNPYVTKDNEYQGQIHCHTTNSDGADAPLAVENAYATAGYDFLCITDHDVVTTDPGGNITLFIQGVEETATTGHIGRLDVSSQSTSPFERVIIRECETSDSFFWMAHPDAADPGWTEAELDALPNYYAIEVYNAGYGSDSEDTWDTLLSKMKKRAWGVAVDDCHSIAGATFDVGWVQVFADSLTDINIKRALMSGNFYSSLGPDLAISVSGTTITATTSAASTIDFIKSGGTVAQTTASATTADYATDGTEVYVRVRITRDSDSTEAWSNPLFINDTSDSVQVNNLVLNGLTIED